MSRVRISTTVDEGRLQRCRRLLGLRDSKLVDRALAALIEEVEATHEREALDAQPYDDDPELAWEAPPGPALPYDGEVPAAVTELAERRRRR